MSTVIKSGKRQHATPPGATRQGDNDDLSEPQENYLDAVRHQAVLLVRKAQTEAAAIRAQAAAAGQQVERETAERLLQKQVDKQLETLLPALQQVLQEIRQAKQSWLAQWQQQVVTLAVGIAECVVRRELQSVPQITLDLVQEALELASGNAEISVHLYPQDYKNLGPQVERLAAEICHLAPSHVIADDQVTAGGCRVETKFGTIDQQIDAQLSRIAEELAPE